MSCSIYGQEKTRYSYSVDDAYSAVQPDTLDWTIADKELDDSDNTDTHTDTATTDTQDKEYHSSGTKNVATDIDFDDGWGNIFTHHVEIDTEALVYKEPIMDFTWDPINPTILEETTFTQNHEDTRDDENDKAYGRIDRVDVDCYNNDEYDVEDIEDSDEFKHTFSPKEDDGIDIRLHIEYWDGWETQECQITKHLTQTNIPPVSESSREDDGVCIPHYIWTAESTDEDDAVEELTYQWTLYNKDDKDTDDEDDDEWIEIDSGTENTYEYPFQYEGDYRLILRTTDDDGDWSEKTEDFTITFDSCGSDGVGGSGKILLQRGQWQMIAMPVADKKVAEYLCDRLADQEDVADSDLIEVVNTFRGGDGKFLSYLPGITSKDSVNNFTLIYNDNGDDEISAMWVKTKEWEHTEDDIELSWGDE